MENENQQESRKVSSFFFGDSSFLEYYINQTARALIALCFTVIVLALVRMFFNLSFGVSIAIAILLGLFLSPILSKIHVGKRFIIKYNAFLEKIAQKIRK